MIKMHVDDCGVPVAEISSSDIHELFNTAYDIYAQHKYNVTDCEHVTNVILFKSSHSWTTIGVRIEVSSYYPTNRITQIYNLYMSFVEDDDDDAEYYEPIFELIEHYAPLIYDASSRNMKYLKNQDNLQNVFKSFIDEINLYYDAY